MISHSDTIGFKENIVKNCIISMSAYAALSSLFFIFVGLAGNVLESKLSLSLTYFSILLDGWNHILRNLDRRPETC